LPCFEWTGDRIAALFRKHKCRSATPLEVAACQDVPVVDRLWLLLREEIIPDFQLRLLALAFARRGLLGERKAGREPDKRSWAMLTVARRFRKGRATEGELAAGRAAASAAATAAVGTAAGAAARAAAGAAGAAGATWAAAWAAAAAPVEAAESCAQLELVIRLLRRQVPRRENVVGMRNREGGRRGT